MMAAQTVVPSKQNGAERRSSEGSRFNARAGGRFVVCKHFVGFSDTSMPRAGTVEVSECDRSCSDSPIRVWTFGHPNSRTDPGMRLAVGNLASELILFGCSSCA
jgi:hypothetical protein